ncbi:MAG: helix-turn-helix domain-containing protein [Firmicutes bacterium]|jgi:transcriptional regulator with XRE-family HTH domain|uniref:Helix-turn-helix domain-containing protein n=1 Tax=Acetobacterium malicum TaxID=52692 RepID=A0ABR6YWX2_9FIRM|nr:helix-turn-helix transcriptional regulator [Acetobacterium malicum]MBC3899705.1 helix-turn-helix domain-containing protein [Acetobacterium malicum]MBU4439806.1 helix-turn-helix domain-containing protein [Bacillota bacterium]PKM53661.1 MAG: XRE family transcriptional regulator [Firmicutes bacterium HGW-Firmicutes-5]PKM56506.1 MAG: XRE family transcriptional regulator [Firmicutes bacterium HGW-Firmicutes-3]
MGLRIKILRQLKDINQAELGKIVGVGKTTISNYETGYSVPDLDTLIKLAEYFNVTTDYLLGLTDDFISQNKDESQTFGHLSRNEKELLEIFSKVTNERDQIKLIGRFDEIVEQIIGDFKSDNAPSTRSKKSAG